MRTRPGKPHPLGATWDGEGVNFALFSQHAAGVELCLFESASSPAESARIPLIERTNGVWHIYLPDVRPGQLYGYRVDGPFAPEQGHRFNRNKLLLDPYAKAIGGTVTCVDQVFGYKLGDPGLDLSFDQRDSAPHVPKSIVVETAFSWGDDRPPAVPWSRSHIYECHVRSMTMRHSGRARAPRRHVPRPGFGADHRSPALAVGHRGRALAGPANAQRAQADGPRAQQFSGATTRSGFSRPIRGSRPGSSASRSTSSRPWSRPCTAQGSR